MRLVWENELGGQTFLVGERFLKWSPPSSGIDLRKEAERLRWAVDHATVPRVVDVGTTDAGSWLFTERLPGESAVADRWKAAPEVAVRAIAEGLRAFHDSVPVDGCPFSWRVADRLAVIEAGTPNPARWHHDHQSIPVPDALAIVRDAPPEDDLVVCHGDTCAPNTLIGDDGRWTGHVDLGEMGVADRWADLAVATWSLDWNYGPGWAPLFLDVYGIEPDPERTRYYRLLWDLGP